jgi:ribosomal protein L37AE/L43A
MMLNPAKSAGGALVSAGASLRQDSDHMSSSPDPRDNFPDAVKAALAKRVCWRCSKCRAATTGPHESPEKSVGIGEAAHITAAAPGGPRFDASLKPDERKSSENGIWLCSNCATAVDRDAVRYTPEVLRAMKRSAEARADLELGRADVGQLVERRSNHDARMAGILELAVRYLDKVNKLRYGDLADYDRLEVPGSLDRDVDELRQAVIPLESLVTEATAAALSEFLRAVEAVKTYAVVKPNPSKAHVPGLNEIVEGAYERLHRSAEDLTRALRLECEPPEQKEVREREARCVERLRVDGRELSAQLKSFGGTLATAGPPVPWNARSRLEKIRRRIAEMLDNLRILGELRGAESVADFRRSLEILELDTLPALERSLERREHRSDLFFDPSWRHTFRAEESWLTTAANAVLEFLERL